MCGIVAYIGNKEAYPILINGLKRLEYRGYDSAGIALMQDNVNLYKCKGKVADLENFTTEKNRFGTLGIAHTRWATHGEPNDTNAHPHFAQNNSFALIHNGIIENYATLKTALQNRGYKFRSDTDTEVLAYLIEDIQTKNNISITEAFRMALNEVVGAYALALISNEDKDLLLTARKGSPLVIGVGDDEFFVASDATPIVQYTKNVIYLNDEEIAAIHRKDGVKIFTIKNVEKTPYIQELELNLESIEKGGYEHFMLKEIYEQPRSVFDTLRGRLKKDKGLVTLGGIQEFKNRFLRARRIIIVGCGTSWHAGLVGEYLFEDLVRIPVEVEYASEFRYRKPVINEDDVVIAISQSGETADTLAAIELAKSKGALIFGICNVVGSSIARASHAGAYTHAGPEIGVASTKAFTTQVGILTLMALTLAQQKGTLNFTRFYELLNELDIIPQKIEKVLKQNDKIKEISTLFSDVQNCLYLGRGYNFPVALEGALKLKEISYIHAEGYPAAEMKHGPIALIDENMPVVVVATQQTIYEKVISNIEEVKARKGKIIAIITEGDNTLKRIADYHIEIPNTDEILVPLLATIPLQLLAYHVAVLRGNNVDQPRNLAKSVTVE